MIIICYWGLTLACGEWAAAHPFHISTAEMEYDAQTDRIQVSLKLQAVDLEQELARISGQRINIEQPQAQRQIIEFLGRNFYLTDHSSAKARSARPVDGNEADRDYADRDGSVESRDVKDDLPGGGHSPAPRSQVHWIGQELKGAWLWLYFELELPPQRQELQLINTVLFELNSSQINTVSVRHGGQRTTLKMTSQHPASNFEAQWLKRN